MKKRLLINDLVITGSCLSIVTAGYVLASIHNGATPFKENKEDVYTSYDIWKNYSEQDGYSEKENKSINKVLIKNYNTVILTHKFPYSYNIELDTNIKYKRKEEVYINNFTDKELEDINKLFNNNEMNKIIEKYYNDNPFKENKYYYDYIYNDYNQNEYELYYNYVDKTNKVGEEINEYKTKENKRIRNLLYINTLLLSILLCTKNHIDKKEQNKVLKKK